jgi:4-methyl-5(b-hydroxyethyl)-thiazole monophosphate biosynthesis
MNKNLALIVYEGVADWEVSFPIFCLRPAIEPVFAALGSDRIKTTYGFTLDVPRRVEDLDVSRFDGVYLPGGIDPLTNKFPRSLAEDAVLLAKLREFAEAGKTVAAICGAPLVLGAAGLLTGKRFACDITEDTRGWFEGATRVDEALAVDDGTITGSVRAIVPFSVEIARGLGDEETAKVIKEFFVG